MVASNPGSRHFAKDLQLLAVAVLCFIATLFFGGGVKERAGVSEGPAYVCETLSALPKDVSKPMAVNFGNKATLLGVTVKNTSSEALTITYYWKLTGNLGLYDRVYVHFTDRDNNILFQGDHDLCGNRSYEDLKGKIIMETSRIRIPQTVKGKETTMKVGLFAPTLQGYPRVKIESAGGTAIDNMSAVIETLRF